MRVIARRHKSGYEHPGVVLLINDEVDHNHINGLLDRPESRRVISRW